MQVLIKSFYCDILYVSASAAALTKKKKKSELVVLGIHRSVNHVHNYSCVVME